MKRIYLYVLALLLTTACTKEIDSGNNSTTTESDVVVLQQRNPSLSRVWSKRQRPTPQSRAYGGYLPPEEFIGYSYRIGNTIVGDFVNTGYSVVDIDRLSSKYPTYVLHSRVSGTDRGQYSYSDFDRYLDNSTITSKKTTGWSVNLGLFKIGRKKITTSTFATYVDSSKKETYGEFWYEARHGRHTVQKNSTAKRNIACDFLNLDFLDVLYNSPKTELLNDYGPFIITDYFTGGRATALFYTLDKYLLNINVKEQSMDRNITASITFKEDSTGGKIRFKVGRSNADSTVLNTIYNANYFSVNTSGGSITVGTPSVPTVGANVDLTDWLSSLSDESTHTLIGFVDEGLSGIHEFLLEENFKDIIQDTHMEYRYNDYHLEPYVEIMKVYVRNAGSEKLYDIAAIVSTRENDKLILCDGTADTKTDAELRQNADPAVFTQKAQVIATNMGQYFQCLIKASPTKTINPIIRNPLSYKLTGVDLSRMKKFTNPNTDMWYIYDPVARIAFAYYMDDYILESYGLNEWAATLPEQTITMSSLAQRYRIFGL